MDIKNNQQAAVPAAEPLCHCHKDKAGHKHFPPLCPARGKRHPFPTPPLRYSRPIKWIAHQYAYDLQRVRR